MKLQTLLPLVTYPDGNSEAVAVNAVAVASYLDADLTVQAVNVKIPKVSSLLSQLILDVPDMIRKSEAESRTRGERLLAQVKQTAGERGVPVDTLVVQAPIAELGETAATAARYYDLSLVGWEAGNPTSRMTAEAVIFGSGRPAVLLPERSSVNALKQVTIAWDGSRNAARAVADALPFLQRASEIVVLTVTGEKPIGKKNAGEQLVVGLAKRGLKAKSQLVELEDCPIGVTLQEHAIAAATGLLVMGGYGHSRVREFVLGGATEGVLTDLRMPVLLSH